jgi:rhodanese-related sulfurtransferase
MRTMIPLLLALAAGTGCAKANDDRTAAAAADHAPAVAEVTVDQVDHLLADHACQAVDANGTPLRQKMGVLPGALLLTDMDAIGELPADKAKPLVFYCANTACSASHYAAEKAIAAGYTHVQVMPDGIAGWVKAGKKTQSI